MLILYRCLATDCLYKMSNKKGLKWGVWLTAELDGCLSSQLLHRRQHNAASPLLRQLPMIDRYTRGSAHTSSMSGQTCKRKEYRNLKKLTDFFTQPPNTGIQDGAHGPAHGSASAYTDLSNDKGQEILTQNQSLYASPASISSSGSNSPAK